MWAQREKRGPVAFWVHVHADKPGETFDQRKAVGMARSEARKWAADPVEEDAPECEGHYDDDRALLLGKPYYCDGKCLG